MFADLHRQGQRTSLAEEGLEEQEGSLQDYGSNLPVNYTTRWKSHLGPNKDFLHGDKRHLRHPPSVRTELVQVASLSRCKGVMTSFPCSTWSAARMAPDGPPVRRDVGYPSGIPDEQGRLPTEVIKANRLVDSGVEILSAACKHGAACILEAPAWRGEGSPDAIIGRERHVSMVSYPPLAAWIEKHKCATTVFDQGMTGQIAHKTTQLVSTPEAAEAVAGQFKHLRCSHDSDHWLTPLLG